MSRNNSISVVIPTYNRGYTLGGAIASVLSQSFPADEIIVVDDGSVDDTEQIVAKFGSNVRYVHQANAGPAAARKRGVAEATFPFIAFLDSDDRWLPNKLAEQFAYMTANPRLALTCHDACEKRGDEVLRESMVGPSENDGGISLTQMLRRPFVMTPTVIVKKEILNDVGEFDESLLAFEDRDLWLRIAAKYPVGYLGTVLAIRNIDNTNLTGDERLMFQNAMRLHKKWWSRRRSLNLEQRLLLREHAAEREFEEGFRLSCRGQLEEAIKPLLRSFYWWPSVRAVRRLSRVLFCGIAKQFAKLTR